eukprot:2420374-Alexandrium_andersonii.AAC.1
MGDMEIARHTAWAAREGYTAHFEGAVQGAGGGRSAGVAVLVKKPRGSRRLKLRGLPIVLAGR